MKTSVAAIMVAAAAVSLAGCGSSKVASMLGTGKTAVPQEQYVQSNQNLAMPPDLRLPAPGSGASSAQAAAYTPPPQTAQTNSLYASEPSVAPRPAQPAGDIYDQYGISKYKPDGTKKTDAELQEELKQAYLLKKRQANPNYGTVWNLGSLFSGN
jgi:hypothetical protein